MAVPADARVPVHGCPGGDTRACGWPGWASKARAHACAGRGWRDRCCHRGPRKRLGAIPEPRDRGVWGHGAMGTRGQRDMGPRGRGDVGTWGHQDVVSQGHGTMGSWGHGYGDLGPWGPGNGERQEKGTWDHGDPRSWGYGDKGTWGSRVLGREGRGTTGVWGCEEPAAWGYKGWGTRGQSWIVPNPAQFPPPLERGHTHPLHASVSL